MRVVGHANVIQLTRGLLRALFEGPLCKSSLEGYVCTRAGSTRSRQAATALANVGLQGQEQEAGYSRRLLPPAPAIKVEHSAPKGGAGQIQKNGSRLPRGAGGVPAQDAASSQHGGEWHVDQQLQQAGTIAELEALCLRHQTSMKADSLVRAFSRAGQMMAALHDQPQEPSARMVIPSPVPAHASPGGWHDPHAAAGVAPSVHSAADSQGQVSYEEILVNAPPIDARQMMMRQGRWLMDHLGAKIAFFLQSRSGRQHVNLNVLPVIQACASARYCPSHRLLELLAGRLRMVHGEALEGLPAEQLVSTLRHLAALGYVNEDFWLPALSTVRGYARRMPVPALTDAVHALALSGVQGDGCIEVLIHAINRLPDCDPGYALQLMCALTRLGRHDKTLMHLAQWVRPGISAMTPQELASLAWVLGKWEETEKARTVNLPPRQLEAAVCDALWKRRKAVDADSLTIVAWAFSRAESTARQLMLLITDLVTGPLRPSLQPMHLVSLAESMAAVHDAPAEAGDDGAQPRLTGGKPGDDGTQVQLTGGKAGVVAVVAELAVEKISQLASAEMLGLLKCLKHMLDWNCRPPRGPAENAPVALAAREIRVRKLQAAATDLSKAVATRLDAFDIHQLRQLLCTFLDDTGTCDPDILAPVVAALGGRAHEYSKEQAASLLALLKGLERRLPRAGVEGLLQLAGAADQPTKLLSMLQALPQDLLAGSIAKINPLIGRLVDGVHDLPNGMLLALLRVASRLGPGAQHAAATVDAELVRRLSVGPSLDGLAPAFKVLAEVGRLGQPHVELILPRVLDEWTLRLRELIVLLQACRKARVDSKLLADKASKRLSITHSQPLAVVRGVALADEIHLFRPRQRLEVNKMLSLVHTHRDALPGSVLARMLALATERGADSHVVDLFNVAMSKVMSQPLDGMAGAHQLADLAVAAPHVQAVAGASHPASPPASPLLYGQADLARLAQLLGRRAGQLDHAHLLRALQAVHRWDIFCPPLGLAAPVASQLHPPAAGTAVASASGTLMVQDGPAEGPQEHDAVLGLVELVREAAHRLRQGPGPLAADIFARLVRKPLLQGIPPALEGARSHAMRAALQRLQDHALPLEPAETFDMLQHAILSLRADHPVRRALHDQLQDTPATLPQVLPLMRAYVEGGALPDTLLLHTIHRLPELLGNIHKPARMDFISDVTTVLQRADALQAQGPQKRRMPVPPPVEPAVQDDAAAPAGRSNLRLKLLLHRNRLLRRRRAGEQHRRKQESVLLLRDSWQALGDLALAVVEPWRSPLDELTDDHLLKLLAILSRLPWSEDTSKALTNVAQTLFYSGPTGSQTPGSLQKHAVHTSTLASDLAVVQAVQGLVQPDVLGVLEHAVRPHLPSMPTKVLLQWGELLANTHTHAEYRLRLANALMKHLPDMPARAVLQALSIFAKAQHAVEPLCYQAFQHLDRKASSLTTGDLLGVLQASLALRNQHQSLLYYVSARVMSSSQEDPWRELTPFLQVYVDAGYEDKGLFKVAFKRLAASCAPLHTPPLTPSQTPQSTTGSAGDSNSQPAAVSSIDHTREPAAGERGQGAPQPSVVEEQLRPQPGVAAVVEERPLSQPVVATIVMEPLPPQPVMAVVPAGPVPVRQCTPSMPQILQVLDLQLRSGCVDPVLLQLCTAHISHQARSGNMTFTASCTALSRLARLGCTSPEVLRRLLRLMETHLRRKEQSPVQTSLVKVTEACNAVSALRGTAVENWPDVHRVTRMIHSRLKLQRLRGYTAEEVVAVARLVWLGPLASRQGRSQHLSHMVLHHCRSRLTDWPVHATAELATIMAMGQQLEDESMIWTRMAACLVHGLRAPSM